MKDERAGVTYTPFFDGERAGWEAKRGDKVTYIYLVPSQTTDAVRPSPDLFLYIGETGDPEQDEPQHFYSIDEEMGLPTTGLYAEKWVVVAQSRGYDHDAHLRALESGEEDAIGLSHPANFLNEEEVEEATKVS